MRESAPLEALHDQSQKILSRLRRIVVAATFSGVLIATVPGHAEDASSPSSGNPAGETTDQGLFSRWLKMVSRTQAEQPIWITPVWSKN
jgi:hypothetical protein